MRRKKQFISYIATIILYLQSPMCFSDDFLTKKESEIIRKYSKDPIRERYYTDKNLKKNLSTDKRNQHYTKQLYNIMPSILLWENKTPRIDSEGKGYLSSHADKDNTPKIENNNMVLKFKHQELAIDPSKENITNVLPKTGKYVFDEFKNYCKIIFGEYQEIKKENLSFFGLKEPGYICKNDPVILNDKDHILRFERYKEMRVQFTQRCSMQNGDLIYQKEPYCRLKSNQTPNGHVYIPLSYDIQTNVLNKDIGKNKEVFNAWCQSIQPGVKQPKENKKNLVKSLLNIFDNFKNMLRPKTCISKNQTTTCHYYDFITNYRVPNKITEKGNPISTLTAPDRAISNQSQIFQNESTIQEKRNPKYQQQSPDPLVNIATIKEKAETTNNNKNTYLKKRPEGPLPPIPLQSPQKNNAKITSIPELISPNTVKNNKIIPQPKPGQDYISSDKSKSDNQSNKLNENEVKSATLPPRQKTDSKLSLHLNEVVRPDLRAKTKNPDNIFPEAENKKSSVDSQPPIKSTYISGAPVESQSQKIVIHPIELQQSLPPVPPITHQEKNENEILKPSTQDQVMITSSNQKEDTPQVIKESRKKLNRFYCLTDHENNKIYCKSIRAPYHWYESDETLKRFTKVKDSSDIKFKFIPPNIGPFSVKERGGFYFLYGENDPIRGPQYDLEQDKNAEPLNYFYRPERGLVSGQEYQILTKDGKFYAFDSNKKSYSWDKSTNSWIEDSIEIPNEKTKLYRYDAPYWTEIPTSKTKSEISENKQKLNDQIIQGIKLKHVDPLNQNQTGNDPIREGAMKRRKAMKLDEEEE